MSADFLIEMAWKSSLVCGGVLLLLGAARDQSPAQRARLAFAGMAILPFLPLLSFALPAIELTTPAATGTTLPSSSFTPSVLPTVSIAAVAPVAEPSFHLSLDAILTLVWLAASAVLLMRLAWGVLTLARWTRQASPVVSPQWRRALSWSGASKVRLFASSDVDSPLSWGFLKPVILIGTAEAANGANAAAIIAHEMAHVSRHDWLRLLVARIVAALFWFNPLVWLLERAWLREMEEAADMDAVRVIEPGRYAETLLAVARDRQLLMANSIAAGELSKRIMRVLNCNERRPAARWKVAALLALLGFAAPVAALQFAPDALDVLPVAKPPKEIATAMAPAPLTAARGTSRTAASASTRARSAGLSSPASIRVVSASNDTPDAVSSAMAVIAAVAAVTAPAEPSDDALDAELSRAQDALDEQSRRTAELAERVSVLAQKKTEKAMKVAAKSMAEGAVGMEKGADGMIRGAEGMRKEAARLKDPAYRQRKIAEEAARGHVVTDQELIDAIPEMQKGADEMVKGAAEMRKGAAEMRRGAREQH